MLHDSEWRPCRVKLAKLEATANIPEVLITSFIFFNVCSQVRVDHADIRIVEAKTDRHSSLVSLSIKSDLQREWYEKSEFIKLDCYIVLQNDSE